MERGHDWFKMWPIDFIFGTQDIGSDLISAYIILLCLMYANNGNWERSDQVLAAHLKCSTRSARSRIDQLLKRKKIIEIDGALTNKRVRDEIVHKDNISKKRAEAGAKGGRNDAELEPNQPRTDPEPELNQPRTDAEKEASSNKNKDLPEANASRARSGEKRREEEEDIVRKKKVRGTVVTKEDIAAIVDHYNLVANALALPKSVVLSDKNENLLRLTLKKVGGVDVVKGAIDKIGGSDFLQGKVPGRIFNGQQTKPFRMEFGKICRQDFLIDMLNGKYDQADKPPTKPKPKKPKIVVTLPKREI